MEESRRALRALIALLVCTALALTVSASASAAISHSLLGSFHGSETPAKSFGSPSGLAFARIPSTFKLNQRNPA